MLGYIKDGQYHRGVPDNGDSRPMPSSLVKAADHDDQRWEHQADLLQPYDAAGRPNEAFIEEYYEEAKNYGMVKETDIG
jgi:hypothetical protein